MADSKTNAAIFSFQWLPPEEMNELDHALIVAEAETIQPGGDRAGTGIVPDVVSETFDKAEPMVHGIGGTSARSRRHAQPGTHR